MEDLSTSCIVVNVPVEIRRSCYQGRYLRVATVAPAVTLALGKSNSILTLGRLAITTSFRLAIITQFSQLITLTTPLRDPAF
jgi:hypothetical protein